MILSLLFPGVAYPLRFLVKSQDIIYGLSPDIPYSSAGIHRSTIVERWIAGLSSRTKVAPSGVLRLSPLVPLSQAFHNQLASGLGKLKTIEPQRLLIKCQRARTVRLGSESRDHRIGKRSASFNILCNFPGINTSASVHSTALELPQNQHLQETQGEGPHYS
jgi:hypothetical protein